MRRQGDVDRLFIVRVVASAALISLAWFQAAITLAQPTNGIVTLVQDTPTTGGGQLGNGNPVGAGIVGSPSSCARRTTGHPCLRAGKPMW